MRKKFLGIGIATVALLAGVIACEQKGKASDNSSSSDENDTVAPQTVEAVVPPVEVVEEHGLKIYYPNYSSIEFVCGERPSKEDSSVVMMAAGAFTGDYLDTFKHSNVMGSHASEGKFYKNPKLARCTGTFVFAEGKPEFFYGGNADSILQTAAERNGMGFTQEMMIHEGGMVPHVRPDENTNEFRALCMIDGKVAVADSKGSVRFGDFIDSLLVAGAQEAMYMDMGAGWNYSWYRDEDGKVVEIHSVETPYSTNWVTFKR